MRNRILYILTAVMLLACMICALACGVQPTEQPTEQQAVDNAVQAVTTQLADYTFSRGTQDDAAVKAREGNADSYVICDDGTNRTLVYIYEDISYDETSTYRYFDVMTNVPKEKLASDAPVLLYLHGGGWVAGNRKEDEYTLLPYLAATGTVVITMEYALWFGFNQREEAVKGVYSWENVGVMNVLNAVLRNETPVSVADQQHDITLCLTYLRDTYLPSLGLTATNIGIGGYSAGAHLSSLYAYQQADKSPIPLAFLLNLAGPVYLLNETYLYWAELLTGRAGEDPEEAEDLLLLARPLLQEMAGPLAAILGEETPIDASTEEGYQRAMEGTERVQPYTYVNENSLPTIMCYAKTHDESFDFLAPLFAAEYDDFIPIGVYTEMEQKLTDLGVVHSATVFDELSHISVAQTQASCKWMAAHVRAYADMYCKAGVEEK